MLFFFFYLKIKFAFYLKIKDLESGGRVKRHRIRSSVKFSWGVIICWCFGSVCLLKSSIKQFYSTSYLGLHTSFMEMLWFPFPAGLRTCLQCHNLTKWFSEHHSTVLDWPANSPNLNPIEKLWGTVKRKRRKCSRAESHYQSSLVFSNTLAVSLAWASLCRDALIQ